MPKLLFFSERRKDRELRDEYESHAMFFFVFLYISLLPPSAKQQHKNSNTKLRSVMIIFNYNSREEEIWEKRRWKIYCNWQAMERTTERTCSAIVCRSNCCWFFLMAHQTKPILDAISRLPTDFLLSASSLSFFRSHQRRNLIIKLLFRAISEQAIIKKILYDKRMGRKKHRHKVAKV